ncbi:MAG TPA: hypothetical protein VFA18_14910 [Gemmataceae bacterium]|jgi:hypothetical protein|nr:hypothetical protein [Gemmataceae bacterium]
MEPATRKGLLLALAPVVAAVLVVFGIIALGRQAAEALRDQGHYLLPFTAIDCTPPDRLSHDEFLAEVGFLAGWPDHINLLDEDLPTRLAAAFALHPWVEKVECVEVKLPHQVRVLLTYREPVLHVAGPNRAVDRNGILLPVTGRSAELPVLVTSVKEPAVVGKRWDNPGVEAAAATAAFLQPHNDRLHLRRYEVVEGQLVLIGESARIEWGHAPGKEAVDEATAQVKLQRLLDYHKENGTLVSRKGEKVFDVRPATEPVHRP